MRNRWAEAFEADQRGPDCERGEHAACPRGSGVGGGFNPRRLRLEFGCALCSCSCHRPCPLADGRSAVAHRVWQASCTCPGAEARRDRHAELGIEWPDFGERLAERQRHSALRREAADAVKAERAGKSRDEIRQLLVTELTARGLRVPADHILEANVDAVMGHYGSTVREFGRLAGKFAKSVGAMADVMRDAGPPPE